MQGQEKKREKGKDRKEEIKRWTECVIILKKRRVRAKAWS